jgi:Asp-tRNA(Asn)/Glu-tRNA(Gln) amidotransferase B subunit
MVLPRTYSGLATGGDKQQGKRIFQVVLDPGVMPGYKEIRGFKSRRVHQNLTYMKQLEIAAVVASIAHIDDTEVLKLYQNINVMKDQELMYRAVMANLHGKDAASFTLSSDLDVFHKFMINDVSGQLSQSGLVLTDIPEYHYGAGRSLFAIAQLLDKNLIRKDQARLLLKDVLLTSNIGLLLEDVLVTSTALDEADTSELDAIVKTVLAQNAKAVQEFKSGKDKAIGSLMGQVMRQMKADPQLVTATIKRLISEG